MSVLNSKPENIKKELDKALDAGSLRSSNLILLALADSEQSFLAMQDNAIDIRNVSKYLAERLLVMSRKERKDNVSNLLAGLVNECGSICCFERIGLLFDSSLKIDPLKLLQRAARKKPIVVFWSGDIDASSLSYSKPGRSDYKSYSLNQLQEVQVITTCIQGVNE